jgi:hypothetical protein
MKKIVCLFSALALTLLACNRDEIVTPKAENVVLPKTIKLSDPNYSSENLTNKIVYDGNKIVSITNERGKTEYTYSGNLIVKQVISNASNTIQKQISYSYLNGKLATISTVVPNSYSSEEVYTDNNDGTVKVEFYNVNQKTGVKTKSEGFETLTFSNGNLDQIVSTYGDSVSTNSYDYDTNSNPFKNVEGFNLLYRQDISFQPNILSANNVVKQTTFNVTNNIASNFMISTNDYDYDAKGFPIKKIIYDSHGTVLKVIEYTY